MNDQFKFYLQMETPEGQRACSAFNVDAFVAKKAKWNRYDHCSDGITAMIAGGVTSDGAAQIDTDREKLAREIADCLTAHIMEAIKSNDLKNGYTQTTTSRK